MTFEQRQAKSKVLCERLHSQVAAITPSGISLWDRAWMIVDSPSATFMTALSAWESDPSDVTMHRVSDAYDAVMAAWRVAVSEYVAEGAA